MLSRRLQKIASFLESKDKVVDIGCDHGYLGIYAIQNSLVQSIILADIKDSALSMARKNVANSNLDIPLIVSDGLENIDKNAINTIVISGMGTSTILHILNNKEKMKNVDKLILQSNNNLDILRMEVTKLGFKLVDEITVLDNNIWYVICLFKKNNDNKLDNKDYYEYLITNQIDILRKLAKSKNENLKLDIKKEIKTLEELLKECRTIGGN